MSKMGESRHFGTQINIFDLFSKSFYVFLKLWLMAGNRKWLKLTVHILKEDTFAQNVLNWIFFKPKSTFLNFSLKLEVTIPAF